MNCMATIIYKYFVDLFVSKNFTKYINIRGYLWIAPSQNIVTGKEIVNMFHSFKF